MLKAVPNKNAGFIILLTSIFTFFFFGEIRNLTTFTRLMDYNNGFSISSFFLSSLSFLWIGAQFPQEKFLSYGRILTLHYYFLLMSILLLTKPLKGSWKVDRVLANQSLLLTAGTQVNSNIPKGCVIRLCYVEEAVGSTGRWNRRPDEPETVSF